MLNAALTYVGTPEAQRGPLAGPQTRARLGSKGRFLVCAGGRRGGSAAALRRCYMLDRITCEWFEIDPLRVPRKQLATAEAGGKVRTPSVPPPPPPPPLVLIGHAAPHNPY